MSEQSPYQAPESDVTTQENEFDKVRILSASQRIGRLRWLAYNFLFYVVLMFISGVVMAALIPVIGMGEEGADTSTASNIVIIIMYIPFIIASLILAIRRLHDLDKSGYFSILLFIPILNLFMSLYLMFVPGTKGQNRYGVRPEPNTALTWIAGLFFPIVIIGILAAIAVPAYNDYVQKAKAGAAQIQQ